MKLTKVEIKQAMECCGAEKPECVKCPLRAYDVDNCMSHLIGLARGVIFGLEKENAQVMHVNQGIESVLLDGATTEDRVKKAVEVTKKRVTGAVRSRFYSGDYSCLEFGSEKFFSYKLIEAILNEVAEEKDAV